MSQLVNKDLLPEDEKMEMTHFLVTNIKETYNKLIIKAILFLEKVNLCYTSYSFSRFYSVNIKLFTRSDNFVKNNFPGLCIIMGYQ